MKVYHDFFLTFGTKLKMNLQFQGSKHKGAKSTVYTLFLQPFRVQFLYKSKSK